MQKRKSTRYPSFSSFQPSFRKSCAPYLHLILTFAQFVGTIGCLVDSLQNPLYKDLEKEALPSVCVFHSAKFMLDLTILAEYG
jgi:hypothetical protein